MIKNKYTFKKYERLHNTKDFKRVFASKTKFYSNTLILYFCDNNLPYSRLGISIKKKFGTAVERNKAKRHIREIFRTSKHLFKKNIDLVILILDNFKPLDFKKRKKEFLNLLEKTNLLIIGGK